MAHKLISFLGKVRKEHGQRYREATYHFDEGIDKKTRFFGLALQEHLQPDELIILGTTGSMWDVFFESLEVSGDDTLLDTQVELEAAVQEDRVTPEQLHWLEGEVAHKLGLPCALRLIPYGTTPDEQVTILQIMASRFTNGDQASLDVTHGLRHLPMLSLVSAMYLQAAFKVAVRGIYYGALEMTRDDLTPVMRLDGLLRITEWVGALHTFDKDGDYGVFAPLLEQDHVPSREIDPLRRAAYFERTFNVSDARRALLGFEKTIDAGLPGMGRLFAPQLRERTQWHKGADLFSRQRDLARFYLERGDYPRSAIFAFEAFITRLIDKHAAEREEFYEDRKHAQEAYEEGSRGNGKLRNDYFRLKNLRNSLAHGTITNDERIRNIIKDEKRLSGELQQLIKALLG